MEIKYGNRQSTVSVYGTVAGAVWLIHIITTYLPDLLSSAIPFHLL